LKNEKNSRTFKEEWPPCNKYSAENWNLAVTVSTTISGLAAQVGGACTLSTEMVEISMGFDRDKDSLNVQAATEVSLALQYKSRRRT